MHAPIALFVYKRPEHTQKMLDSLLKNKETITSPLYVYADGPKTEADRAGTKAVRALFENLQGFQSVTVTQREKNLGLAENIINGVSEICQRYGRVIVLEDDWVFSPYFLQFMNEGLNYYANQEQVASIHGYTLPVKGNLPENFLLRGADCGGWATWQRAWCLFEPDATKLLGKLKSLALENEFDLGGVAGNFAMLNQQQQGIINSWAIRWHASMFLANKLTLYPGKSLVNNIGHDASGEHCGPTDVYTTKVTQSPVAIVKIPLIPSATALAAYKKFYINLNSLPHRILRRVKRLFKFLRK